MEAYHHFCRTTLNQIKLGYCPVSNVYSRLSNRATSTASNDVYKCQGNDKDKAQQNWNRNLIHWRKLSPAFFPAFSMTGICLYDAYPTLADLFRVFTDIRYQGKTQLGVKNILTCWETDQCHIVASWSAWWRFGTFQVRWFSSFECFHPSISRLALIVDSWFQSQLISQFLCGPQFFSWWHEFFCFYFVARFLQLTEQSKRNSARDLRSVCQSRL